MRSHLHSLGSKLERRIKSCLDLPEEGSSSSTGGKDFDYMTLMFTPRSGDDADDSASATPSALPSIASSTESEPYRPTFTKKTGRDRMFSIVPRKARAPHSKHYDRIPDAKRAEALIAQSSWIAAIAALDLALKKIPRRGPAASAYKKARDRIILRRNFCKSNIQAAADAKHELHLRRAAEMPRVAGPNQLRTRFLVTPPPAPPPGPAISPEKQEALDYMREAIVPRPASFFAGRLRPALQWDNEESVLRAVRENGSWLRYADPWLKAERSVVLAAVENDGTALRFADKYLRGDKGVGMVACRQNGWALQFYEYRGDRDVVLCAARQNGLSLIFADHAFMADEELLNLAGDGMTYRDIVLRAVQRDGCALKFAHVDLRGREAPYPTGDREVCLAAVTCTYQSAGKGQALQYCGPVMRRDKALVMAALETSGLALQHVDAEMRRSDREVLLHAMESDGLALQFVGVGSGGVLMGVRPSVVLVGGSGGEGAASTVQEPLAVFGRVSGGRPEPFTFGLNEGGHEHGSSSKKEEGGEGGGPGTTIGCFEAEKVNSVVAELGTNKKKQKKRNWHAAHGKRSVAVHYKPPALPNSSTRSAVLRSDRRSRLEMVSFQSEKASARVRVLPPLELQGVEGHPLRGDREIVLMALENNGMALEFAAPRLRADFDVCMAACSQDGRAIQFVDARAGRVKRRSKWAGTDEVNGVGIGAKGTAIDGGREVEDRGVGENSAEMELGGKGGDEDGDAEEEDGDAEEEDGDAEEEDGDAEEEEWTAERKRRLLNTAVREAGFQLVVNIAPDEIIL